MPAEPVSPQPRGGSAPSWDVPWTLLDAALAFIAGILIGTVLRGAVSVLLPPGTHEVTGPIAGGVGLIAGVVGWLGLRHPGTLPRLAGPGRLGMRAVLAGCGHGVAAFVVLNLGAAALFALAAEAFGADLPPVQESLRRTITDPEVAAAGLVYALAIAVVAEEVFFRGLLLPAASRLVGRWPAIGFTGLLFGLAHYQPDPLAWTYTLTVMTAFGMYLAWAYDRYRHLVAVLVMHGVFNGLAIVAILGGWG